MAKFQFFPTISAGISAGSGEFWRENVLWGWPAILVVSFLILWVSRKAFTRRSGSVVVDRDARVSKNMNSEIGISSIISDDDLRNLINNLEGTVAEKERWDDVIEKRNTFLSYKAKCCKPKDGPLKYFSVTTFENCSTELLRDFYMDNEYRKKWDKTLLEHEQLQIDQISGTEVGRTIKKFPLLTPREYVLSWRQWEGKEKTFYCFIKECEHPVAPRQKKFVRVSIFRSGWRIRKVPGRNACEIAMVHQEDAGLNIEMAKLAFSRGIWGYVCKMDSALRKYPHINRASTNPMTSPNLVLKVPAELEVDSQLAHGDLPGTSRPGGEVSEKKLLKRPSKRWVTNGLLLIGGVICLSRGHSSLSAKIAIACILKKFSENQTTSNNPDSKKIRRAPQHHN